jgi:hypothetical protein
LTEVREQLYFKQLLDTLDQFKTQAQAMHATPFVSTERLFAFGGMALRSGVNDGLYQVLNGPTFWPFSYDALGQMLAAHNATITTWAEANSVKVIDIDRQMPKQADLYADPWHDHGLGQQKRAWLIFQALVPQIVTDLRAKRVPRDNSDPSGVHPYLEKEIKRIDLAQWLAHATAALNSSKAAKN